VPSTNKDGMGNMGGMSDFATGWDDATLSHGRPAAVAFAPDGRLFVANDNNGVIFWIAPMN
jgi:glucose/arabinose dehydrogenase